MQNNSSIHTFSVALNAFRVCVAENVESWESLEWHYQPFACEDDNPLFSVDIVRGALSTSGTEALYVEEPVDGDMGLCVHRRPNGALVFTLQQPYTDTPNGWLEINADMRHALLAIDEDNDKIEAWKMQATLTSGMMLAYLLATTPHHTLMSHAACAVRDGKAYFFIGKSGTGKSTHSRLWLKHLEGSKLLNDDHPIVRVDSGSVIAYGSPWSGKTNCYKNQQAPLAAIVRIKQDPENICRRLRPVEAYASLSSSFSGVKWIDIQADARHASLEALVRSVPCYELRCRPDQEAAEVCWAAVSDSQM